MTASSASSGLGTGIVLNDQPTRSPATIRDFEIRPDQSISPEA
jgi:hypothetical protein